MQLCCWKQVMFPRNPCLSSISCCGLNAILMISVEDEIDVTACQVRSYPFLDIHDEISYATIHRPMYSPKQSWSIYDSDICITSIPPRDFYLEQPLEYVLWFTNPYSFFREHYRWDRCKLIEDILHINISITRQQCNDSSVNGIQVIYFWVTNLDRFAWCPHGLDFLRDSAVEPFWPSLLIIFQHSRPNQYWVFDVDKCWGYLPTHNVDNASIWMLLGVKRIYAWV